MPCLFDTLMYCVFSFVVIFWITVQVRFGASLLIKEPARTARAQKPKSPKAQKKPKTNLPVMSVFVAIIVVSFLP